MDFLPNLDDLLDPVDNVDITQSSTNQQLEINPLARVRFDEPIDNLISRHISRDHVSPFKSNNVKSNAAKIFYTSFFLGLLMAENAKKQTDIVSMYKRVTENTLELLVVYGSKYKATLHIHEIDFGEALGYADAGERDALSGRRLAAIKRNMELIRRKGFADQRYLSIAKVEVYKYKLVGQPINPGNDRAGFRMIVIARYVKEAEIMDNDVKLDEVDFAQYNPLLEFPVESDLTRHDLDDLKESLQVFSRIKDEPDIHDFRTTVENAMIPMYHSARSANRWLPESLSTRPKTSAAEIGLLHGALFAVFPDNYYKRVMSNGLMAIYYSETAAHLYLTASSKMSNEHVLIDFDTSRINYHDGYDFLTSLKQDMNEAKILEIRYFLDETGAPGDGMRLRTIEWNIHNIMQNLHLDALEATVAETEAFKTNYEHYSQIIQNIITDSKFGHIIDSHDSIKSFFFGQLKTNPNVEAWSVTRNPNEPIQFFTIKHGFSSVDYISFDQEHNPLPIENLVATHVEGSIFCLNFRFVDGQMQFVPISMTNEEYRIFRTGWRGNRVVPADLRTALEDVMKSYETPEAQEHMKTKLHNELKSIFSELNQRHYTRSASDAYLAGVLSNLDVTDCDITRELDSTLGSVVLSPSGEKNPDMFLSLVLLNEKKMVAAHEAVEMKRNNAEHAFTIVYNRGEVEDGLAVAASSNKHLYLNTDNVHAICESSSRPKRSAVPYCQLYNEDEYEKANSNEEEKQNEGESEKINQNKERNDGESTKINNFDEEQNERSDKINYEEIERGIAEKFPSLHEHISLLHRLSTNLQLGFLGRDMFGNLYQKNLEGFAQSVFFFGTSVASSIVGQSVALFGQSQKIAGKKITGKVLGTVGGCLPNVGFDIYMGYQLKMQIKHNNTKSAMYTSAYIGLDLIQCALAALNAFDVIALNPVALEFFAIPSAILMTIQNAVETHRKVEEIDKIVHLTIDEKLYEVGRELFFLGTDSVIQSMVDEVTANEAVVSSFGKYKQFHRFLISAASKTNNEGLIYIDDNNIDLTKTYKFNKSRLMPRDDILKPNITTFCAMNEEYNPAREELEETVHIVHTFVDHFARAASRSSEVRLPPLKPYSNVINDFFCENAFGVADEEASETSKTLYQLFNGTDNVTAFPAAHNVFLLMNGMKLINGGISTDEFIIKAEYIFGYLDGSDGEDIADFSASNAGKDLVIKQGEAFFSPENGNYRTLRLYSIETIIGRQHLNDFIEVCNETKIDLGGSTYGMDRINISDICNLKKRNLTIFLRKNTFVTCEAEDPVIRYIVTDGSRSDLVLSAGLHELHISSVDYFDLTIRQGSYFREMKFGHSSIVRFQTEDMSNVTFLFTQENIAMKMDNQNNITLYLTGKNTVPDIIEKYAEYVEHNNHVKVIAKSDEGTIVLHHNVFSVEFEGKSRQLNVVSNGRKSDVQLVGHKIFDNYFLISDKDQMTLLNITIHPHLSEFRHCYINLRNLAQELHKHTKGGHGLLIHPAKQAEDMVLKIFILSNTEKSIQPTYKGRIVIKDGFRYADQIKVHMYDENSFTHFADRVLLKPPLIHINRTFVTLFPGNLEFNAEVNFDYSAENLKPYRLDKSLLLTNILPLQEASSIQPITIVLIDYFAYQAKYDTLSLIFDDQNFDFITLVRSTKDIRSMWIDINKAIKYPENVASSVAKEEDKGKIQIAEGFGRV